jgi:anti-sigma regulatory factor (Ser/Thr protein kinase)
MATVTLRLSPQRAHVRTARLVAVAMARRSGVSEQILDEIRLAVGEACGRAVQLHERHGVGDLVALTMTDDARFEIVVRDQAPLKPVDTPGTTALDGTVVPGQRQATQDWEEPLEAGLGLALLDALVDDITVDSSPPGSGTTVRMSWPIETPPPDDPGLIAINSTA